MELAKNNDANGFLRKYSTSPEIRLIPNNRNTICNSPKAMLE
jgi:hypothetical protein